MRLPRGALLANPELFARKGSVSKGREAPGRTGSLRGLDALGAQDGTSLLPSP